MIGRLRTPRNRELVNLLLVAAITVSGFLAVFVARDNAVSTVSLTYAGLFLAPYAAAHLFLRVVLPAADPYLLPCAALLSAIGEIEIYRIDPVLARTQSLWVGVGIVVLVVVVRLFDDPRRLEALRYTAGVAAVLLLLATVVLGTSVNGARLWIRVGSFQIQPGEFAKVLLVVFMAGYLRVNGEVLTHPTRRVLRVGIPALRHVVPLVALWGAALVLLVAVNDFGSSLLYYAVFLAMLYVATGRPLYVGGGIAAATVGGAAAVRGAAHVRERIDTWIDPWRTARGSGYQIIQSLYSIADGGVFGSGFGRGFVLIGHDTVIPAASTDFIYSVIATETGLAGAAGLLLVYLVVVFRGLKIASVADDTFTKLLAAGLAFALGFQAFVIVAGVTKLLPLTGITLPFVSYGGSSVVANFGLLGLLLCASARANRLEGRG